MDRAGRIVAWLCIFSLLLTGCYTPSLIDATGEERKKIYATDEVYYVITKDSIKHVFDYPPVVTNDTIMGQVTKEIAKEVSIPLSDLAQVGESRSGTIEYVITKAGTKYPFEKPPAIANGAVVGEMKPTAFERVAVAIPLSDVREACISELSQEQTWLAVFGVVVLVAGAIALWFWSENSFAGALGW
jgi:hypothetical protein